MKRTFVFNDHRYINWYAKKGINLPNKVWQAINEAEYCTRSAYDTDKEEHTVVFHVQTDNWHTVVIASKYIETDGTVSYVRHKYCMRFNSSSTIPQIEAFSYVWGNDYWGDTLPDFSCSSDDDRNTAWEIMKAVNKYFRHSDW